MKKVIRRRIRQQKNGINVAADVDAVVSVSAGESGRTASVRMRSDRRVAQRSGSTTRSPATRPDEGGDEK